MNVLQIIMMLASWWKSLCSVKCENVVQARKKKFHWLENLGDILEIDIPDQNVNCNVKSEKIAESKFKDHRKRQNSDLVVAKVQKRLKWIIVRPVTDYAVRIWVSKRAPLVKIKIILDSKSRKLNSNVTMGINLRKISCWLESASK